MDRHNKKKPYRLKEKIDSKNRKISKRKYLSYEDEPLENTKDEILDNNKISKSALKIIGILVICTVVTAVWANWSNLRPDKVSLWFKDSILGMGSGSGYPSAIVGKNIANGNFKAINKDIAFVSDTSFVVLNRSAKQVCAKQHSFGSPVLKIDGNLSMIYNQNGKGLQIESTSKEIFKTAYSKNIQSADISNSGIYGVVTDSDSYLSELTIYNRDNSERFKYHFSECYIVDVDLNSSGDLACASGVMAKNGDLISLVYLFDFNKPEPVFKFEYPRTIISSNFLSDGNIAVVGDSISSIIKTKNKEKTDYDYQNKTLTSYDINKDLGILITLSPSGDGRNCDVAMIYSPGKVKSEFNTDLKVISSSVKGDTIALLSDGELYGYSLEGKLYSQKEAKHDANKVVLVSGREAYILGISEIRRIFI